MKESNVELVDLLWTGGWDSTFRLLQLIFLEKKTVKPYYLVRYQECTGKEIDTINNILRIISRKHPKERKLILPFKYIDITEVSECNEITEEYERIQSHRYISPQYEMLARLCRHLNLDSIELCVLKKEIREYFTPDSPIFKNFSYPLKEFSKKDIHDISKKNQWMEIMNHTWFCRRPVWGKPCGFCAPCTDTVIGGMGWRLPIRARILAHAQIPFRKWWRKNYLQNSDGYAKYVRKLLKHRT